MTAAEFGNAGPTNRLLLRGAKQIVTLRGPSRLRQGSELRDVALIRDGSILIEGGVIRQVGSARRVDNLKAAATARELDARHLVILPGLLDAVHDLLPLEDAAEDTTGGAAGSPPPSYREQALHTVVRSLDRQFVRLALAGTAFARFRLRFPEDANLQGRLLRNVLQLEQPRESFRVELHFHRLPSMAADASSYAQQLSRSARGYWTALEASLSVSIRAAALDALTPPDCLQALRRLRGGLPCCVTHPEHLSTERLLAICAGSGSQVMGALPARAPDLGEFARHAVPWVLPVGALAANPGLKFAGLREAVDAGMALALCSGYDVNHPGAASTLPLSALLCNEGGLTPEEILQLSIANLAHGLGVGDRMGSIQAGYQANLVLLHCDDYREIGRYLGGPPILATLRRGVPLHPGPAFRGQQPSVADRLL